MQTFPALLAESKKEMKRQLPAPSRQPQLQRIRSLRPIIAAALAAALLAPAPAGPDALQAQDAADAIDIDGSIDAGVEFLIKAIEGPNGWTCDPKGDYASGYVALQVYALVKSDVSYQHPVVAKGIEFLQNSNFDRVYCTALYLMAYDAMVEQMDADVKLGEPRSSSDRAAFLEKMQAAATWIAEARLKGVGAWSYQPLPPKTNARTHRWDNYNAQFAVLALGIAAERKLKVPPEVWAEVVDHFVRTQDEKGDGVTDRPIFRPSSAPGAEKAPRKVEKEAPTPGRTTVRKANPLYGDERVKILSRGWVYSNDPDSGRQFDSPFSMICAGVSSLLLAQRNLPPAFRDGPRGEPLKRAL